MKNKRKVIIEKYWVIRIFIKDFLLLAFYKFNVFKYFEEPVQKLFFSKFKHNNILGSNILQLSNLHKVLELESRTKYTKKIKLLHKSKH